MSTSQSVLKGLKPCRFRASKAEWRHISSHDTGLDAPGPSTIRIVTWNVQYETPEPILRMRTILNYLSTAILQSTPTGTPEPCCILLQEVNRKAFVEIRQHQWVQEHFTIVPVSADKWPAGAQYGNVSLVSRSIAVASANQLEFSMSRMGRTGLAVDIKLTGPSRDVMLRVINTHLESLPIGAPARPRQMALLAGLLKAEGIGGGVIAGDMNAISRSDMTLVADIGLRDTWRRGDSDPEGFTWGFQPQEPFPPCRMDKVVYLPRKAYQLDQPERIGVGLATGTMWTSDHFGLVTTLRLLR